MAPGIGATQTGTRSSRARAWRAVVLAASLAAAAVLAGCGSSAGGGGTIGEQPGTSAFPPVEPASGTSIPQVTVQFGMRPVANDVIYVVGMNQGWFKDVGINIAPAPYGNKSTFNNAVPLLVDHQLDIEGLDPIPTISTLGTVKEVRFIGLSDIFLGFQILAAPQTHAKTVQDFMNEGLPFKEAIHRTLQQMEGQKFTIPPIVSDRGFLDVAFGAAGMNLFKDTHVTVTADSTALNLASSGQVKFATFDGAPFTAQLLAAGWIPIVTPLDLSKNLPPGVNSPAELLVEPPGIATTAYWAVHHPDTVLRFVSVMFRIIHAINSDPPGQLKYELGYLNAFAGTSLHLQQLQTNITKLDPLIPFEEQDPYFNKPGSALYYKNWYQATLKYNIDQKVVPSGQYNADDLIWAGQVYHQLVSLKTKCDNLLAQLRGKSLSQNAEQLVTQGRQFYAWYDFLDGYRYLKAAEAQ